MEQNYFKTLQEIKNNDVKVLLKKSYRGIWETAIKKYSGSAHFVYELLQNADDAKATWVHFDLREEGLWFKHNGTVRFSISNPESEEHDSENGLLGHINSITSIGNSTKIDEQKIGKFGIGFKAVFAYSNTPHIYDDNFNFKLENYIVPVALTSNGEERNKGETLFYFPFNHNTKSAEEAYDEIETKLENLFQPILFLTNLETVEWHSIEKSGVYSKEEIEQEVIGNITATLFNVVSNESGVQREEQIWLFTKSITRTGTKAQFKISVGFFVLDNAKLETGYKYDAFCFFPTKEDTKLGFIIQAPFLLTDSREGIQSNDSWNQALIQSLAELSAQALPILKDIGVKNGSNFFDDTILELTPYNPNEFPNIHGNAKVSFLPFYSEIKKAFGKEQILPGRNGVYFTSEKAYWAADPELSELFSDTQLSDLFGNPNSGWVFVSKGQKQLNQANKALESYINSIVVESVDAKKLLRRFTKQFVEKQTDEWLIEFYTYLSDHKYLWDDKDKLALKQPIVLNQDRKAVTPYNEALTAPNIFLPLERASSYDTIYLPFADNKDAMDFFKTIGIGKPDIRAEIFNDIIPQYNNGLDYDNEEVVLQHFETLLNYYENCPAAQQVALIAKLNEIQFIACRNPFKPDTLFFAYPSEVYFNESDLKTYFANSEDAYFLDEDFYAEFVTDSKKSITKQFFRELGLKSIPRIIEEESNGDYITKAKFGLDDISISIKYKDYQKVTDKNLDGLEVAVQNITPEISLLIWNYLLHYANGLTPILFLNKVSGKFFYYARNAAYSTSMRFDSTMVSILKNDSWLMDKEGNFIAPSELSIDTLNEAYNVQDAYASVLLNFLGINNPDADLNLTEEQLEAYKIGKQLLDENITAEELSEIKRMLAARRIEAEQPELPLPAVDEVHISETEIQTTLTNIGKGIKKNKKEKEATQKEKENTNTTDIPSSPEIPFEVPIEPVADQDDYTKPSVDLQKKIDKLKLEAEAKVEELTRIEKLTEIADTSEKYSFAWFKALLELEYLNSSEANAQGKQISIQFAKVEPEAGTERILVLKHPNRYIPQSIEDIGDMQIRLYQGEETVTVTVEVVNVKEYTLRAKLKKSADLTGVDFAKVTRAVIDIKNPVFIIEELRKAFYHLGFEDDYNLQTNLTDKIRFIFGPPGTGKTTYLATNEIIPMMKEGHPLKVLVLTPTNKAADVLTKRIVEKMGDDESYHSWLLRFGTTGDAELENSGLVIDKTFDIRKRYMNTTITTIARFAYDYFQPDEHDERLHLKFLEWDFIIIDEASMINLASIAYVLYQKRNANFIIAGDPFQIQPITQIEQWKDMNIYEMVQLNKFVDPVTIPHTFEIVNLQKQYRSVPTIGSVFSHFTYNGILEHHRTEGEQKPLNIPGLDFKDINIIKFPVQKFESVFKPNTLNKSNYQAYSAIFTVEFAMQLAKHIRSSHKDNFRIGIICPYKAQATLIEKLLARLHNDDEKVEILIGTIHGFQGDECDIIISVFNPPFNISKSPAMFLNKQNVLNVAISRARDYLFILMPDDYTQDVENLYRIKKIERLINNHSAGRLSIYNSDIVEEKLLGSESYVYDNTFATSHQSVNVYSKPEKKYEIRCEEIAVDVQLKP